MRHMRPAHLNLMAARSYARAAASSVSKPPRYICLPMCQTWASKRPVRQWRVTPRKWDEERMARRGLGARERGAWELTVEGSSKA